MRLVQLNYNELVLAIGIFNPLDIFYENLACCTNIKIERFRICNNCDFYSIEVRHPEADTVTRGCCKEVSAGKLRFN